MHHPSRAGLHRLCCMFQLADNSHRIITMWKTSFEFLYFLNDIKCRTCTRLITCALWITQPTPAILLHQINFVRLTVWRLNKFIKHPARITKIALGLRRGSRPQKPDRERKKKLDTERYRLWLPPSAEWNHKFIPCSKIVNPRLE